MNTTPEERNEIVLEVMKSILSSIPIVGLALHILFEYRGKVKQERLNSFLQLLKNYFSIANPYVDFNKIKSEEFSDLFENILKKVTLTKGERKLEGFKNILLKGMSSNNEIEYCEIFVELLSHIHEKQIEILNAYEKIIREYSSTEKRVLDNKLDKIKALIEREDLIEKNENKYVLELLEEEKKIEQEIGQIEKDLKSGIDIRKAVYYDISEEKHSYYLHDLFNKGLIYDEGIGGIEINPFEIMCITDLGMRFRNTLKKLK